MKTLGLFVAHALFTLAGSIGAIYAFGWRVYGLVGVLVALVTFALIVTSNARAATSSNPNPDVVLQPMPWHWWVLGSLAIALVLGGFWPVLPFAIAIKKATARSAVDHVYGSERPPAGGA